MEKRECLRQGRVLDGGTVRTWSGGDHGKGGLQVFGPGCSVGDDMGEVGGDHILMDFVCSLKSADV